MVLSQNTYTLRSVIKTIISNVDVIIKTVKANVKTRRTVWYVQKITLVMAPFKTKDIQNLR